MAGSPGGVTDHYLALAQALYGSGADFKKIWDEVITALDAVLVSQDAYDPILDQLTTMTNVLGEMNTSLVTATAEGAFAVQSAVLQSSEVVNASIIDLRHEQEDHKVVLMDIRSELRSIREDSELANAA